MKDEIIQEVWKAKDALAAKCRHDVRALVEHLRAQEQESGATVVDLHARHAIPLPGLAVREPRAKYGTRRG